MKLRPIRVVLYAHPNTYGMYVLLLKEIGKRENVVFNIEFASSNVEAFARIPDTDILVGDLDRDARNHNGTHKDPAIQIIPLAISVGCPVIITGMKEDLALLDDKPLVRYHSVPDFSPRKFEVSIIDFIYQLIERFDTKLAAA